MSKEKNFKRHISFKQEKFLGTLVHLLTGFGIIAGFFSLISVLNNNQKDAFLWLGLAFLIDSIDGTLARKFDVKKNLPNIDGKMLDSIIDFFNYVMIPSIMIYWFNYVPDQFILLIPVILIFISIYSYVNLNILTNDNYYNGFPAIWNVVVLYFPKRGEGERERGTNREREREPGCQESQREAEKHVKLFTPST